MIIKNAVFDSCQTMNDEITPRSTEDWKNSSTWVPFCQQMMNVLKHQHRVLGASLHPNNESPILLVLTWINLFLTQVYMLPETLAGSTSSCLALMISEMISWTSSYHAWYIRKVHIISIFSYASELWSMALFSNFGVLSNKFNHSLKSCVSVSENDEILSGGIAFTIVWTFHQILSRLRPCTLQRWYFNILKR
jgi:hypothetical protein